MSKTMAEVLADKLATLDKLTDGDGFTYSWFDMERPDLARELTAALTAAGFGLVADAKGEALEEAAAHLDEDASASSYLDDEGVTRAQLDAATWLRARARAAAVRGEG